MFVACLFIVSHCLISSYVRTISQFGLKPALRTIIAIWLPIALTGAGVTMFATPEPAPPSGAKIEWKNFNDGLAVAKSQKKKILVDVYTDWCGWCKKMDKEVYSDDAVVSILKSKFVAVKLNAESDGRLTYNNQSFTQAEFSQALGVTGYPATAFFGIDSKPITVVPGYIEAKRFAQILRFIGDDHYLKMSFNDFLSKGSAGGR